MGEPSQRIEFLADLAKVVDRDPEALEKHAELLEQNAAVRELLEQATELARRIGEAGGDYRSDPQLAVRALASIDARGGATQLERPASERPQPEARRREAPSDPAASTQTRSAAPSERSSDPLGSRSTSGSQPPLQSRRVRLLVAGVIVAAGAAAYALYAPATTPPEEPAEEPPKPEAPRYTLGGRVTELSTANADRTGLATAGKDGSLGPGSELSPGDRVSTDAYTRAAIALSDGSSVLLNHNTQLTLDGERDRTLSLKRGELLAEVAQAPFGPLVIETPMGRVEITGTKFALSVSDQQASVRVARGEVRLLPLDSETGAQEGGVEIHSGQEGIATKDGELSVAPMMHLSSVMRWAELNPDDEDGAFEGLGELTAHVPGEREETERPLSLSQHKVKIRIAGNMARTEIEEVFKNDGDKELEGVYRFPLPPEARIESLSLLVDGEWKQGAFVERDRGRKIWRGVIRNAEDKQTKPEAEEYIWVPGPWRDPALLQWQQGGRFELRIFPIPARGSRRIRLAYTQSLTPSASGRRYVYPLSHASTPDLRVGHFEVQATVQGTSEVRAEGYRLQPAESIKPSDAGAERAGQSGGGDKTTLYFERDDFVAAGDLVLNIAQPQEQEQELQFWSYDGNATVAPGAKTTRRDPALARAQARLHGDRRGYVTFALRPELPDFFEGKRRHYLFIIDTSQSMFGERFDRASALVQRIVAEMDRRDSFEVLACDATCRSMDQTPVPASTQADARLAAWLSGIRPAGASDLEAALLTAEHHLAGPARAQESQVVYIGDGLASVGTRSTAALAELARRLVEKRDRRLSTVAVGAHADALTLRALARAGRGHHVSYLPGQSPTEAALNVLETGYGASLAEAKLQLPDGLSDVAPAELPTLRDGQELIVSARVSGKRVEGDVVLSGTVGGQAFENRYPVVIEPSSGEGNRFVPGMWAAQQIDQLQERDDEESRQRATALSIAYGVMSRHTSLLVLESEAMFDAFGIDAVAERPTWSGEEQADGDGTDGLVDVAALSSGRRPLEGVASGAGLRKAAKRSRAKPAPSARAAPRGASPSADAESEPLDASPASPTKPLKVKRPGGRLMKQRWVRVAKIDDAPTVGERVRRAVDEAVSALGENPDSRDRHRSLVRALSVLGNVERARQAVEDWIARDALDPEALTYLSDAVGRQGDRALAIRLLTGIVDLQPHNVTLQSRLARAFERAGLWQRACAHRRALAEIEQDDVERVADAVRCLRQLERPDAAEQLLQTLPQKTRKAADQRASEPPEVDEVAGDFMVEATWEGPHDLDLTIVTNQGTRLSWLGGRVNVVGSDAKTQGREQLGIERASAGSYTIEVTRTDPDASEEVQGQLVVEVLDKRRRIPFVVRGKRQRVARVTVRRERRLVEP